MCGCGREGGGSGHTARASHFARVGNCVSVDEREQPPVHVYLWEAFRRHRLDWEAGLARAVHLRESFAFKRLQQKGQTSWARVSGGERPRGQVIAWVGECMKVWMHGSVGEASGSRVLPVFQHPTSPFPPWPHLHHEARRGARHVVAVHHVARHRLRQDRLERLRQASPHRAQHVHEVGRRVAGSDLAVQRVELRRRANNS